MPTTMTFWITRRFIAAGMCCCDRGQLAGRQKACVYRAHHIVASTQYSGLQRVYHIRLSVKFGRFVLDFLVMKSNAVSGRKRCNTTVRSHLWTERASRQKYTHLVAGRGCCWLGADRLKQASEAFAHPAPCFTCIPDRICNQGWRGYPRYLSTSANSTAAEWSRPRCIHKYCSLALHADYIA